MAIEADPDPEIVLRLPLSMVRNIIAHLEMGTFKVVYDTMNQVCWQAGPQVTLATAGQTTAVAHEEPVAPTATERLN